MKISLVGPHGVVTHIYYKSNGVLLASVIILMDFRRAKTSNIPPQWNYVSFPPVHIL